MAIDVLSEKSKCTYDPSKYAVDLNEYPSIITDTLPGPKSNALHARAGKHIRGLSGQVRLFPVAFESGDGCKMIDADGNKFIDFSSGIYVTNLGHWDVVPDVATIGKGFGNGFPVTAMVVRQPYAVAIDKISASTSYGGNPMACAAALASIEVIEEEGLLDHAKHLEDLFAARMADWTQKFNIVGDCRVKGCLMGVELVKDKNSKEPFDEAGKLIYQRAFSKGLAWIPAGHILRMSPPIVMPDDVANKAMDMIEEAIGHVEKELGYAK